MCSSQILVLVLNFLSFVILGEETVATWVNPTQSERNWRSTIVMAYHSSPHLAFQLTNRFKNLDTVSREVNRLVHSNPVAFVDTPDAAQVHTIITKGNLEFINEDTCSFGSMMQL